MEDLTLHSPLMEAYQLCPEDLDYRAVEKSTDLSFLVKVLRVLRSDEVGYYPDLIKFTEERIMQLNPKHRVLKKSENIWTPEDLDADGRSEMSDELKDFCATVRSLEEQFSHLTLDDIENSSSPIRHFGYVDRKLEDGEKEPEESREDDSRRKRLKRIDYKDWEKLDAENAGKEPELVDSTAIDNKGNVLRSKTTCLVPELNETDYKSDEELALIAAREKAKGNEAYKAGDYQEAAAYFTRSISARYSALVINNRAQSYIKLGKYLLALEDCKTVLEMEPDNLKAHLRSGTAAVELKEYSSAREHFSRALELSPESKVARDALEKLASMS